eukprot:1541959-Amphidinium_carterae.1
MSDMRLSRTIIVPGPCRLRATRPNVHGLSLQEIGLPCSQKLMLLPNSASKKGVICVSFFARGVQGGDWLCTDEVRHSGMIPG